MLIRKLKNVIRNILNRFYEFKIVVHEFAANKRDNSTRETELERKILLSAHSLEKGMGLRNSEPGHGSAGAEYLLDRLNEYLDKAYNISMSFAFKEGVAALREYINYQKSFDAKINFVLALEREYTSLVDRIDSNNLAEISLYKCGVKNFDSHNVVLHNWNSYEHFIKDRHSIRIYKDEPVDTTVISAAVNLANHSPSACNRQPNKVYFTNDSQKTRKIDSLIIGNRGFEGEISNYIVLTTNRTLFAGDEQFQWYVGGYLFS